MNRTELLARIQEVGGIQAKGAAEAVLETVLEALWEDLMPQPARSPPLGALGAASDWRAREEGIGDLLEREEMLCEEEACRAH